MKNTFDWLRSATISDATSHGLKPEEFESIEKALGRKINLVELGICSALFSEHCSYKSTKVHLRGLPTSGKHVLQGPGENAGILDIGDGLAVAFKVESHNHPSFIEPFQGAATGVGGILRDIFTMGARPVALLNSLRFGDPTVSKTKYLIKNAVKGIGFYGNCMGIPTVGGELFFHPSFNGNCLVNAFALGVVKHNEIFKGNAAGIGNPVIYVGSKTGRDGIHGATMSSESFSDDADQKRPTVQVGDPFQEKLLLEACLEAMKSGAIIGIQDMGAAGLTSSSFEMADRGGSGVKLHLDRVPQRETGMNPYEIMLSESQERMLMVVERGREQEIFDIFQHWELDVATIGEVTETGNVDLYWNGELVSSMPAQLLTSAVPEYCWPEKTPAHFEEQNSGNALPAEQPKDLAAVWLELLGSPNLCSRHLVYSQYDSTVRGDTVVHPGSDAGIVRVKGSNAAPEKGIAITLDCNSRYCAINPKLGTAHSLAEAIRNLAATGAEAIGISDCLNMPSPEKPESMWQIAECIRGLSEAARNFEVPVISGNVSLYNETNGTGIYPTPLLAVVGLISDASKAVGKNFRESGEIVLLIGETDENEVGGSEYLSTIGNVERGPLPKLDYQKERRNAEFIRRAIDKKLLSSCHDLSDGGLASALAEACFREYREPIGVTLKPKAKPERSDGYLFSETTGRYLASCSVQNESSLRKLATEMGITIAADGVTGGDKIIVEGIASINLKDAARVWGHGLDRIFGVLNEKSNS